MFDKHTYGVEHTILDLKKHTDLHISIHTAVVDNINNQKKQ